MSKVNNEKHVTTGVSMDEEKVRLVAAGGIFLALAKKYAEHQAALGNVDEDFSYQVQELCYEIARVMDI